MRFPHIRSLVLLVVCALAADKTVASQVQTKWNVLFIAVDDLRPELACYGHPAVQSPHIDRLAANGTLFTRAYCQQAVCNPSRASLMTGLRPESLGVTDLPTHFRDQRPDAVTVAQYFKQHGYASRRVGKIFHTGHGNRDDALSWSKVEKFRRAPRYGQEGNAHLKKLLREARAAGVDLSDNRTRPRGLPWEAPDVADEQLADGSIAKRAIALLQEHQDEPFFEKSDYRAYELYDLHRDPDENVNRAGAAESRTLVQRLAKQLHGGWEAALPDASGQ